MGNNPSATKADDSVNEISNKKFSVASQAERRQRFRRDENSRISLFSSSSSSKFSIFSRMSTSRSETSLSQDPEFDLSDFCLTEPDVDLIKISWRLFKEEAKTSPGQALFRKMFVVEPQLQDNFGFNYNDKRPHKLRGKSASKYISHADAFNTLMENVVEMVGECLEDQEALARMLAEVGQQHRGRRNAGFEPKYVRSFTQTLNAYIEESIEKRPNLEKRLFTEMGPGIQNVDVDVLLVKACQSAWQNLSTFILKQMLFGYRTLARHKTSRIKKESDAEQYN